MARDVEDGNYTRIHNDIMSAMARADFTIREYKCLLFLLRKTYGWQKKKDAISLQQWSDGIGLTISAVAQTLTKLEERNVIKRDRGVGGRSKQTTYMFNKYFEQWQTVSKETVSKKTVSVATVFEGENSVGSVKKTVSVPTHTKERKKVAAARAHAREGEKTAAAATAPGSRRDEWIAEYERVWGRLVESPDTADEIDEWKGRVTLDGWRYSLTEARDADARNWKYLRAILTRIERDGVPCGVGSAPDNSNVSVSLKGLLS